MTAQPYAHVKDGVIVRRVLLEPADIPAHKASYLLPINTADRPIFDTETEVLVGPIVAIGANSVEATWNVRAKTQAEVDASIDERIPADNNILYRVAFNQENRIRTLESRPTLIIQQFKTILRGI